MTGQSILRKRIYKIVDVAKEGDRVSYVFDISILALILANVIAAIIGTIPSIDSAYGNYFHAFEVFSVIVFTVEYLVRAWCCVEDRRYSKRFSGRIKYLCTPMALIDLFAILPFYLVTLGVDFRALRVLRLFRLLRIAKAGRYLASIKLMRDVYRSRREELTMAVAFMIVLLILASSAMYYAENDIQPEAFSSIPASMWWAVATLTTVGYGDVYPVTNIGKLLGAVIAVSGIGLFGLPAGLLASGFMEEAEKRKKKRATKCKHCGNDIND